jgi:hypothetical protein
MYDEQSDGLAERRANPLQVGAALIDCGFISFASELSSSLLQSRALYFNVSAALQS